MDHLPLPRNAIQGHIEVPYRCTEDYDGGSLLDYPDRVGWKVIYSPYGITYLDETGVKPTSSKLEAFIQTWLYFGFLHEILGGFADINTFVTTRRTEGKEHRIVTMKPLKDGLVAFREHLVGCFKSSDLRDKEAAQRISHLASSVFNIAVSTKVGRNPPVDERIWLAFTVLVETVLRIYDNSFPEDEDILDFECESVWRISGNPGIGQFLVDGMLLAGWCPFDVHRTDKTVTSATVFYFLANMPPPRPEKDHSVCSKDECTSMRIGASYRTTHAPEDCRCDRDFADPEGVIAALQGHALPLIQPVPASLTAEDVSQHGNPMFRIIESQSGVGFVAISHVWAEGLGNPHANSLPTCALKWISDTVQYAQLRSSQAEVAPLPSDSTVTEQAMPFWIDTICVPVSPPEMWTRAMNRLREPYQEASAVLVVDSYLYTQDSRDLSATEMWARILCCSWSRRLWTFQEARLARPGRLYFLFQDRPVAMEEIWLAMRPSLELEELVFEMQLMWRGSNVVQGLKARGWAVSDSTLNSFWPALSVLGMRESLKARTVSVASDVKDEKQDRHSGPKRSEDLWYVRKKKVKKPGN